MKQFLTIVFALAVGGFFAFWAYLFASIIWFVVASWAISEGLL